MDTPRVVIVGAGHASVQLCASLRQHAWAGEILLIGDEPSLPYQRPPLSKGYLAGKIGADELLIRTPDFYDKQAITAVHARVERLHPDEHWVELVGGADVTYDHLVLCTGARARRLPILGSNLDGVHVLRQATDVGGIRADLPTSKNVVVVGGGYVGLETAASLRSLGHEVTVLEAGERVLNRVTAPEVSAFYERIHRRAGVIVRTGVEVVALEGDGRVRAVRLADGESLPADLVVAGIGVVPETELAEAAGIEVANGIRIDANGRTSHADIYAAGDCANYEDPRTGDRLRLESVPSAVEQAKVVAATICGKDKTITALPWFWSDQFDLKLQIAGLSDGYDDVVLRGDPSVDDDFVCFYLQGGRLIAADCVNRPQEFMFSKRAIVEGITPPREVLADSAAPLAPLLAAGSRP